MSEFKGVYPVERRDLAFLRFLPAVGTGFLARQKACPDEGRISRRVVDPVLRGGNFAGRPPSPIAAEEGSVCRIVHIR